jgi:hypothetical protein
MDQLQQIKSLSNELSENVLFNYSKRGVLILMELISWAVTFCLFGLGIKLLTFMPSAKIDDSNTVYVQNRDLESLLSMAGLVCLVLSFLVLLITLFIRRTRRKKTQVYQLTQLIRNLK